MSGRPLLVALGLFAALAATPPPAHAQAPPGTIIDLVFSTTPIDRNASMVSAAVATVSRAGDVTFLSVFPDRLRAPDKRGAALRFLKLALLDVPIVHYADGLNHEFGHIAKANEVGIGLQLRLVGGPWSTPQFDLHTLRPELLDLGSIGGGFDAELALERRLWDRAYEENSAGMADAITLLDGAVGRFYYVQRDLSTLTGRPWDDLVSNAGDPRRYVYHLVGQRLGYVNAGDVLVTARSIQAHVWLNFADVGLWAQAWNVAKYVWHGDAAFQPYWLRLHGVGLAPFSQYHLSPAGPQIEVGTRYRAGEATGQFCVRWTEPIRGSRLVGSGFSWSTASGTVVHPRLRVDLWRGPGPGVGARFEAGATAARWPSPRAGLQVAVGAKSEGYVLGLPQKHGGYLQAGLRLKF